MFKSSLNMMDSRTLMVPSASRPVLTFKLTDCPWLSFLVFFLFLCAQETSGYDWIFHMEDYSI